MTKQEKAIAAFDVAHKGRFEMSWMHASICDSKGRDILTANIAEQRADLKGLCAILNNRAEQTEHITQLEADKAELVEAGEKVQQQLGFFIRIHRTKPKTLITTEYHQFQQVLKKHEAKHD